MGGGGAGLGHPGVELALLIFGLVILAVLAEVAEGAGLLDQLGHLFFPDRLQIVQLVIEEEEEGGDYVRLGSTVTVLDKEFNEEESYKIVGSQEADPMKSKFSLMRAESLSATYRVMVKGSFPPSWSCFSLSRRRFKKYDIGDIVGVHGVVFRTQRGEMSVRVVDVTLLSPCRPR